MEYTNIYFQRILFQISLFEEFILSKKMYLLAMYISIQKRLPMHGIISAMVRNSNLAFQSHSSSYALNALLEEVAEQR